MIQPFWRYISTSNSRCLSLLIPGCQAPLTCLCLLSQQHIHSIICKIPKLSKFKESLLGIRSISDSTKISWTISISTEYLGWNINGSGQNKIFVSHPAELELDFWNVIFCSWSFLEKYHTKFLDLTSYLGHWDIKYTITISINKSCLDNRQLNVCCGN